MDTNTLFTDNDLNIVQESIEVICKIGNAELVQMSDDSQLNIIHCSCFMSSIIMGQNLHFQNIVKP